MAWPLSKVELAVLLWGAESCFCDAMASLVETQPLTMTGALISSDCENKKPVVFFPQIDETCLAVLEFLFVFVILPTTVTIFPPHTCLNSSWRLNFKHDMSSLLLTPFCIKLNLFNFQSGTSFTDSSSALRSQEPHSASGVILFVSSGKGHRETSY